MAFEFGQGEDAVRAEVDRIERGGGTFVSLGSIMEGLGGTCSLRVGRVQLDYRSSTVWLQVGERDVRAPSAQFSLRNPIVQGDEGALMALSDVVPFFSKAFRTNVRLGRPLSNEEHPLRREAGPAPSPEPEVMLAPLAPSPDEVPAPPPGRAVSVIVIDPGHGGSDVGATGSGGLQEKDVALGVAREVQRLLEAELQVKVFSTRDEDVELNDSARARFALRYGGGLFISIHLGDTYARGAEGFEIFYHDAAFGHAALRGEGPQKDYTRENRRLSLAMTEGLSSSTGQSGRGIHAAPCRVLDRVQMPGCLVEVGCISSSTDEKQMATSEWRGRLARGIVDGVKAYLGKGPGLGATP